MIYIYDIIYVLYHVIHIYTYTYIYIYTHTVLSRFVWNGLKGVKAFKGNKTLSASTIHLCSIQTQVLRLS